MNSNRIQNQVQGIQIQVKKRKQEQGVYSRAKAARRRRQTSQTRHLTVPAGKERRENREENE